MSGAETSPVCARCVDNVAWYIIEITTRGGNGNDTYTTGPVNICHPCALERVALAFADMGHVIFGQPVTLGNVESFTVRAIPRPNPARAALGARARRP